MTNSVNKKTSPEMAANKNGSNQPTHAKKKFDVSELTVAFVDTKVSKRAAANGASIPQPEDIDIRKWPLSHRSTLISKTHISIFVNDAEVITLSKPLLKATSTKYDELVKNGKISLTCINATYGLHRIADYFSYVTRTKKPPARYHKTRDEALHSMLSIIHAARLLGVDKYFSNVYAWAKKALSDSPGFEQLLAITEFRKEEPRLWAVAIHYTAIDSWNGKDVPEFQEGLLEDVQHAVFQANTDYAAGCYRFGNVLD